MSDAKESKTKDNDNSVLGLPQTYPVMPLRNTVLFPQQVFLHI